MQLTRFVIFDSDYVPAAAMRHRTFCSFQEGFVLMCAAPKVIGIVPRCFKVNQDFGVDRRAKEEQSEVVVARCEPVSYALRVSCEVCHFS